MNARGSEVFSPTAGSGSPPGSRVLAARDLRLLTACGLFTVGAGVLATVGAGPLLPFALRAGLYDVVRAAIVGSVLSNVLLVLGLAFVAGGLKHGRQKFSTERSRTLALMLVLAVFALAVPTLTDALHTPAAGHEGALSVVTAVVLLVLFGLSLPAAVAKDGQEPEKRVRHATAQAANVEQWPLALAIGLLAAAGVSAAFVSEWFVAALTPAMDAVHISPTFAGLVIVAIAGNAVENVVGIQLALRNQADYALSVICLLYTS